MRAVVLALGDGQSYILTTARDDLGVIHALSLAGVPLRCVRRDCPPSEHLKQAQAALQLLQRS